MREEPRKKLLHYLKYLGDNNIKYPLLLTFSFINVGLECDYLKLY